MYRSGLVQGVLQHTMHTAQQVSSGHTAPARACTQCWQGPLCRGCSCTNACVTHCVCVCAGHGDRACAGCHSAGAVAHGGSLQQGTCGVGSSERTRVMAACSSWLAVEHCQDSACRTVPYKSCKPCGARCSCERGSCDRSNMHFFSAGNNGMRGPCLP